MAFPGGASCPVCGGPPGECQDQAFERMGVRFRKAGQDMAGKPEYLSTERVYELDDNGQPLYLKYPVGAPIPEDEAIRQGLVKGKARTPAGSVEDKAVRAPADKPAAAKKTAARKPAAKTASPAPADTQED